ncbi:MAG TPA: alpha/beta hydrolase-fold protein [Vicinamibacterales bacterium]|nr:alpha/beta hydrolase-fold protein [Vicinamibacterales bacterium]
MEKHSFDIWSPQLRNRRPVDVYLPASYGDLRRRYPVVYMQDGQNLSDPATAFGGNTWRLHDGLARLAGRGIEPIVVGVHNTGERRLSEYSPFPDRAHGAGQGDRYVRFLAETVRPRIDGAYRTRRDREATAIAGASMGGLISLYAFFRRPSPFGRAAVMSPSIWFGGGEILRFVERARPTRGRIYLDTGTDESAGTLRDMRALARLLRRRGYGRGALRILEARGGRHSEADWAVRLPSALEFLFGEG